MKKFLTAATPAMLANLCLLAQQLPPPHPYAYEGPRDNFFANVGLIDDIYIGFYLSWTTLGRLARYSDIIGVGVVSDMQTEDAEEESRSFFTVTVDHALVGCTNGQSVMMYTQNDIFLEAFFGGRFHDRDRDWPTNQSRIVFSVFTNDYRGSFDRIYWSHPQIPHKPEYVLDQNTLRYLNRSWWYPERDDGVLFTQFTNVLQTVRFDRNWTNFFYLCRDSANSPSNRVREDSFWDLHFLCSGATNEQEQFIRNDPLVDPKHKAMMLDPLYRAKTPDE